MTALTASSAQRVYCHPYRTLHRRKTLIALSPATNRRLKTQIHIPNRYRMTLLRIPHSEISALWRTTLHWHAKGTPEHSTDSAGKRASEGAPRTLIRCPVCRKRTDNHE